MAAPTFPQVNVPNVAHPTDLSVFRAKASKFAVPLGRALFAFMFIFSGIGHFDSDMAVYAESMGLSYANILVPASGAIALLGGLSILLGYHARIGALLLLVFLLPVTFTMHAFWNYLPNTIEFSMQLTHFMKNLCLMGAALYMCFWGAGPYSIDHNHKA